MVKEIGKKNMAFYKNHKMIVCLQCLHLCYLMLAKVISSIRCMNISARKPEYDKFVYESEWNDYSQIKSHINVFLKTNEKLCNIEAPSILIRTIYLSNM